MKALIPQIVVHNNLDAPANDINIDLAVLGTIGDMGGYNTGYGKIGVYCRNFVVQQSRWFEIDSSCFYFTICIDTDYYRISPGACFFRIENACTRFNILNGASAFWVKDHSGYFDIGCNSGENFIFPPSSKNFSIHHNINAGTKIDFVGLDVLTAAVSKNILKNNAGEVVLIYFDSSTGQTIVNLSSEITTTAEATTTAP